MRLVSSWLRELVDIPVDDRRLAEDLTMAGIAIDSVDAAENGEVVLEADIATNRPDAMNHYGVAREASTIYDRDLRPYGADPPEAVRPAAEAACVEVGDPDLCARYSARVILGVKVGPSPEWMVRRLEAAGSRSINNVADVTNYLLLELGHPLHAFDLDTLEGRKIIVRRARDGETMTTLDGVARTFTADNLMIADARRPVAIAGVMGGLETGIQERTTNVLLESAWFEPRSIRRTARQFGMHTDASHRFERGADLGITATAAGRAAELIRQVAGGEILQGVIDVFPGRPQPRPLRLRHGELHRILGDFVPPEQVERILRRLGFLVTPTAPGEWSVLVPTHRPDVEREIDVVEEVARHFGYQRFPGRLPAWAGVARRAPHWEAEQALDQTARALGYSETIAFSLVASAETRQFSRREPVGIANPLSEEAGVLRTSTLPSALSAVEWNLNRGVRAVRLFEIGKVYYGENGRYEEPPVMWLAASGPAAEPSVHRPARETGFYDLKGDLEVLLGLFQHAHLYFDADLGVHYYHPGRSARAALDGETVARFGEIHPAIAAARKFRQPVLIAELYLDRLWRRSLRQPAYEPVSRVPAVDRDLSLLVPELVTFEQIEQAAHALNIAELAEIQPVELLRAGAAPEVIRSGTGVGAALPAGRYSLLLRLVFRRAGQSLADAEVNEWTAALAASLRQKLGITQRT